MSKRRQPAPAPAPARSPLTQREQDVLQLLADGKRNKEIAVTLNLSENTIETHLKAIFKKLRVRTRVEAALMRMASNSSEQAE